MLNLARRHQPFRSRPVLLAAVWYNLFMRVLFIGGTGIISTACTDLAISRGIELTLLNRGRHTSALLTGARSVTADIDDPAAVSRALAGESFDAVVDFDRALCDPEHPIRMLPSYDCGDHLHPSDLGYNKMGDAIDLALFG